MKQFNQLLKAIPGETISLSNLPPSLEISGLGYDSRSIKPGELFFAISGYKTNGRKYLDQALARGASGIVAEGGQEYGQVPALKVKNIRRAMALMAAEFYDRPADKMTLLAITGTAGKTTTSYLARSVFAAAGKKVGLLGTINYWVMDKSYAAPNTTPESLDLQRLLAEMLEAGADTVIMEASSHGIELERVAGIDFKAAAFTNFSQDHLDFHGSLDEYLKAKLRLFQGLSDSSCCVVNVDDPASKNIIESTRASLLTFGLLKPAQITARNIESSLQGTKFQLVTPEGNSEISLSLAGQPNVYNALTACGLGLAGGLSLKAVKAGLEALPEVSGRFQRVSAGQDYEVVVDYAHTPQELERVLITARQLTEGRLITVFGCGGNRDRGKRPLMGKAVAGHSDIVIVTSDNPRTEDPASIINDILPGLKEGNYQIVADRRQAIFQAVAQAQKGDLVMIAGKGHEDYQIIGAEKIHFDDREVALEAIESRTRRQG
ncbi:UDP-N-acetylmuramoyl-L-alanyl-D-glutamate--2,6-diaminopimelate ligase [candidate division TA06 bacterium]|uniref:UDP-N-acetylmuramoyl-L-alanyl-D-glutamate--2,6-diaminopimelate ligase n=1 Tax=candidate division TA06 bacterium TaxID=2250710 RepID=A0A933I9A0_UNCT6|nr:UDP-N-acetylmuramoyl-L-alanyl-D-glutamate--2,6-diaminopimelate ligase [candidate division TA06 bacterium]